MYPNQNQPQYQYPNQYPNGGHMMAPPPPPAQPSPAQQRAQLVNHVRHLRNELTQAYNPYSLQKILDETLKVIEFVLTGGQVVSAHPNQVPGLPVNPLDTGKARVELFGGPNSQPGGPPALPAGTPINNGDVQFTHAPGGGVGGQTVEYYAGPPGTQHSAPNPDTGNGQRVEYFGGAPAAPPINTVNNPPQSQLIAGRPAVTVEAGEAIHHPAGSYPVQSMPIAQPFAQVIPQPARRPVAPPPSAPEPQNREDLINLLPIPVLDNV